MNSHFDPATALVRFLGFLVAIIMSQAGIAIMAKKLGDKSAVTKERATINPIPHIDPIGTILFPAVMIFANSLILLGWTKFFTIDPRGFKKIKRDIDLSYLSGIAINFGIALICALLLRALQSMEGVPYTLETIHRFFMQQPNGVVMEASPQYIAQLFLVSIGFSNIVIGALNVLPVPGSCGWFILLNHVSPNFARTMERNALYISIGFLLLFITGIFQFYFNIFVFLFLMMCSL